MIDIVIPNFFFQSCYNLKRKPMFLYYYFLFFEDLSQLFQAFFDYLIDCKILIFLSFKVFKCFSLNVSVLNKKKQYLYIFYFKFLIDNLNRLF